MVLRDEYAENDLWTAPSTLIEQYHVYLVVGGLEKWMA